MRVDIGAEQVRKQAENSEETARLAREAEALSAFSHPGLVPLVGRTPPSGPVVDELITSTARGGSMSDVTAAPLDLLAGWTAAVATVLEDLHSIGLAHGAVTTDHILFDSGGRPVLCGLSRAVRQEECTPPARFESACLADLRAVASMLDQRCPPGRETERLRRRLTRWERSLGERPSRQFGLRPGLAEGSTLRSNGSPRRSLAAAIVDAVPSARVGPPPSFHAEGDPTSEPSIERTGGPRPPGRSMFAAGRTLPSRRLSVSITLAAALLGGLILLLATRPSSVAAPTAATRGAGVTPGASVTPGSATGRGRRPPATPAPPTARSAGPDASVGAAVAPVIPDRSETVTDILPGYELRTPATGRALTVFGRWGCGPERPAVLYLGDGAVWVFSSWPSSGTAARAVESATVPDAAGLAVEGGTDGCDQLVVLRTGQGPTIVPTGGGK